MVVKKKKNLSVKKIYRHQTIYRQQKKIKYMGLGECIAMLIGFRPSQPPAAAPLCRGFRAAVRVPVPPSAVRPRAGGAPRPRLGLQKAVEDLVLCDLGSVAGSMPWAHTLGFL